MASCLPEGVPFEKVKGNIIFMNAQKLFSKMDCVCNGGVIILLWGSAFRYKNRIPYVSVASQDTMNQLMFAGARFLIAGIWTLFDFFFVEKKEHKGTESSGRKDRLYLWHLSDFALQYVFIILVWRT